MKISTLIQDISQLPPTPQILPKLQELLADPDSSLTDVTKLIRLDPALTAQIIKISNSVYYGGATAVESIDEAVNRVGFNEVYKLVGMIVTRQILGDALPIYNHDIGHLWETSILTGVLMYELAWPARAEREVAYTVGLLHGLGKVIINAYHYEHGIPGYEEHIHEMTVEWEREILGFTHAEVSSELLQKWSFDGNIRLPIEYQHRPYTVPPDHALSTSLLYVAKAAVRHIETLHTITPKTFEIEEDILEMTTLDKETVVEHTIKAEDQVRTLISSI